MRAMPVPPITALLWEWWDESAMPSAIDETAPYPYSITSAERVGGAAMTPMQSGGVRLRAPPHRGDSPTPLNELSFLTPHSSLGAAAAGWLRLAADGWLQADGCGRTAAGGVDGRL